MVVTLEGPCYAGKTTACQKICFNTKYVFIPEYSKFTNPEQFPDYRCSDEKTIFFFLKLEEKRQILIQKALKKQLTPVLDRSFFACIAFDYAMGKMGFKDKNFWEKTMNKFLTKNFIKPNFIFLLDVDYEQIKRRTKKHPCDMPSFFTNNSFNEYYREFILSQKITPVIIIDANKTPQKVVDQILIRI